MRNETRGHEHVLVIGEVVETGRRRMRVSQSDVESIARMRPILIEEAAARSTVTYGELVRLARLSCAPKGLGRLLTLLSEDCERRGEPTLAAIVVTQATGEVGDGYGAGARQDRDLLFDFWGRGTPGTDR